MNARSLWIALLLAAPCGMLVPCGWRAAAQQPSLSAQPGPSPAATLRFRRVYAPLDRLKECRLGDERYVPMEKSDFERLAGAAADPSGAFPTSPRQALTAARYVGRFVGDATLEGEALLDVGNSGGGPTAVSLEPCGLAIHEAAWVGEKREAARLGLAADGTLILLVERAGQLELKWSLRGKPDAFGWLDFPLELPPCPATRLVLDLPPGLRPVLEQGVKAGESPGGAVRWSLELGGNHRQRLRLAPVDDLDPRRKLNRVRQTLVYDVSLRGVDVAAQMTLDVPHGPLRQVTVEIDPELQLVTAHCGELPVSWTRTSGRAGSKRERIVLELPEPIQGSGRVLRLTALAPVELGRRWRLPALQPEGMFWQEGTATLVVPAPLVIAQLATTQARQTATAPLAGTRVGESVQLQYFSPDAAVDVLLERPQSPLQVDCGTSLELDGVELTGRVVARLRVAEGQHFQVDAEVGKQWTVDSVETIPPNTLDDWSLQKETGKPGKLAIRLAKAVLPNRPARVVIAARHLQSPLERVLASDDLTPIRFHAPAGGQRLILLRAAGSYQLKVSGAERLTRVDPQNLKPGELELLAETSQGLLFENDAGAAPLQVRLEPQKPSYSAAIRVEAIAGDDNLVESYQVQCVPEAGRVDRILVQFSPGGNVPLKWTLGPDDEQQITARPAAAAAARSQTWEITLHRPRSVSFEIRATRTVPWTGPLPLSLAWLPEAGSQRGTVVVGSAGSVPIGVENRRLTAIPAEPVPADRYSTTRAAFRYDPPRDAVASVEPAIVVRPGSRDGLPSARVWSVELQSRFEPSGRGHHLATYRLESAGREALEFALPAPLTLDGVESVWIDNVRTAWQPTPDPESRRLRVPLPQGRRFPVVSIQFLTAGPPLGIVGRVEPLLPEVDVPMLDATWTVWLPPGYSRSWDQPIPGETPGEPAGSLARRLLGPWVRPSGEGRFALAAIADWPRFDPDRTAAAEQAGLLLEKLGSAELTAGQPALAGDENEAQQKTVRPGWLEQLVQAAGSELTLLVDRRALAQAGLNSRTTLASPPAGSAEDRGSVMLQRASLVLLFHRDVVLLTSVLEAALHRSQLQPLGNDAAWQVTPGPLAERILQAALAKNDPWLVAADAWRQKPGDLPAPWTPIELAGGGPSDALGWTACRIPLPPGAAIQAAIYHRDTAQAFGWAAFLATLALAVGRGLRRPGRLTVLAGLAAALALLLPEAHAPIASAALLGLLTALVLRLLGLQSGSATGAAGTSGATQLGRPAAGAGRAAVTLLGIAWLASVGAAPAAETAREPPPPPAKVHSVFIPVDENQQPTGEKYFVPEVLYGHLRRLAAAREKDPQGWLLLAATYRSTLSWQAGSEEPLLGDLRAGFDLEVFARKCQVRIPLAHEGVQLLPDGVRLDGRAIHVDWPEGSRQMTFEASESGRYRLEIGLRPILQSGGGWTTFQMGIPRVSSSRLELVVPGDMATPEVAAATGAIVRDGDPPRIVAQLGPSDRLRLRWPQGMGRGAGPAPDLDELLWLRIKPGAVVLDALLKFKAVDGRVRHFELAVDPRLRLLPMAEDRSSLARVSTVAGRPQTIHVELSGPAADPCTVPMSFLVTESSGVGNLRVPYVSVLDARVTNRWLAVSVDRELAYRQEGTDRLEPLAVSDFLAAWGETKTPPTFAYALSSRRPDWSLAVQPIAPQTTVDQTLALAFGGESVEVLLDARLMTGSGSNFQYRIAAGPDLEVEQVSLVNEGVERVARWCRGPDGALTVFLNGPATGKQELSLRGRLATPGEGPVAMPIVRLEGKSKSMVVQVFRKPATQVEVVKTAGLAEIKDPVVEESKAGLGRLVKAFSVTGSAPPEAGLRLSPNRPRLRAEQVTLLRNEGEAWEAEVEFRISAGGGLVDEFRLDVPAAFTGPYKVTPPAAIKVVDPPGKGRRQLVLRPRAAVEGSYRLQVSGPVVFPAGERVAVVKIGLEQAEIDRHLIVLPARTPTRSLAWETRGLTAHQVPEDLAVSSEVRNSLVAYRVIHEPLQALLRSPERASGRPQVLLADVRIAWDSDDACCGLATFDLDPADLSSCRLRLPPRHQLVLVSVAGAPATPEPAGSNQWEIPLGPGRLPQRIEVVFLGRLAEPGAEGWLELAAPSLEGVHVRQTLWTISTPPQVDVESDSGLEGSGPLQQLLHRLRTTTEVMELGLESPLEEPEESGRWYPTWASRWSASHAELKRHLARAEGTEAASSARAELETLERRRAMVVERLGTGEDLTQGSGQTRGPGDPADLWLWALQRPWSITHYVTSDSADPIRLVRRRLAPDPRWYRLLGAIGLVVLSYLAVRAARRPILQGLLSRWPQAAIVALGAAWWLWLTPGVLGWGIILAGLVGAILSKWPRRKPLPPPAAAPTR